MKYITCVFLSLSVAGYPAAGLAGLGFKLSEHRVYTLYRSGASSNGDDMRIHVATFDADESELYNRNNCQIARDLFLNQPGVSVRYWCEKGYFNQ